MTCTCIQDIDAKLAPDHSLDVVICLRENALVARPFSNLIRRDNGRPETRRGKHRSMIATFCPFCGEQYDPDPAPPAMHRGAEREPGSAGPAPSDHGSEAPADKLPATLGDAAEPDVHGGSMAIDDLPVCDVSDPDLDRPAERSQNDETWEPNGNPNQAQEEEIRHGIA